MIDKLAYFARYIGIYLLFALTMGLSCIEKFDPGVPQWFSDTFGGTWVASFPGLTFSWKLVGVLEAAVVVLLIISIVTLEVLPKRRKPWLMLALGVASIVFMILASGQRIAEQFDGAASLFFYFGATMATMLVVMRDVKHNARSKRSDDEEVDVEVATA